MSRTFTPRELEVKIQQMKAAQQPLVRSASEMMEFLFKDNRRLAADNALLDQTGKDLLQQKSEMTVAALQHASYLRTSYDNAIKAKDSALAGTIIGITVVFLKTFRLFNTIEVTEEYVKEQFSKPIKDITHDLEH